MSTSELKTQLIHAWALYDHELAQTIEALQGTPRHKGKIKHLEHRRNTAGGIIGAAVEILDELDKIKPNQLCKLEGETHNANPIHGDRPNTDDHKTNIEPTATDQ